MKNTKMSELRGVYVEDIIKNIKLKKKVILKGPTGAGKSAALLNRYKDMISNEQIPSSEILILLLNRSQSLEWRKNTVLKNSGEIWRTSYYGFVQSEINKFYPIVLKNCKDIKARRISPIFLTFESAQFLVSKVVGKRRETEGLFDSVAAYTDRISIDITSNLVKAAISDICHQNIGKRLYNSLERKDEVKAKVYRDLDLITNSYRKKCFELGVFDFGMTVDIFNRYLLTDKNYKKNLLQRIRHVIIDNIEECCPAEIDLVNFLIPEVKSCCIVYNYEGGYGKVFGGNFDYMKNKIPNISCCDIVEFKKTYTSHKNISNFSEVLYEKIKSISDRRVEESNFIERVPVFELRSEMLEKIGERVIELISVEGYQPSDVIILSTYADPVSEYVIGRILEKKGYMIKNLARKSKVLDNSFSQALVTLAQLCHPQYGFSPNTDAVRNLIKLILNIDAVRSSILAKEVCKQKPFAKFPEIDDFRLIDKIGHYNLEKYTNIKEWIENYRNGEPYPINEFFQKVFLEILITSEVSQMDILQAKNLIDSAGNFVEVVSKFNRNANRDFVDMIRRGVKASESIFELEEKLSGDFVLLATPTTFLANSLSGKVIILSGISSNNWTPRNIKEITNNNVLTKTWKEEDVYTEEIEEFNKLDYMATIMRAVLKRCEQKLITFESDLSASGFENDGVLADYFESILG